MFEIIPNWHPVFVHFTVALLSLTVVFHLLGQFLPDGGLKKQCETLADWNLWLGTGFGLFTALAGLMAANSVAHDEPAHVAMMDHKNWALATLTLFLALSVYSLWRTRDGRRPGGIFLGALLLGGVLLGGAAWRGAEVVYRHGVGVMAMPQPEAGGHDHAAHDHAMPAGADQHEHEAFGREPSCHTDHEPAGEGATEIGQCEQASQAPESAAAEHEHADQDHSHESAAEESEHEEHVH